MTLYIDMGNSRIRLLSDPDGIGKIVAHEYRHAGLESTLQNTIANLPVPDRVVVASVAGEDLTSRLNSWCESTWSVTPEYLQSDKVCCGVTNGYHNPAQLGIDRWLAMIAAWNKYRANICVFDCGSAVTADLVTAAGQHLGGYIIPGYNMMQQSLVNNTGLIRLQTDATCSIQPGINTDDCVYHGTTLALVAFIEKIMDMANKSVNGTFKCIITGGGADLALNSVNADMYHEQMLVMEGIKLASKG